MATTITASQQAKAMNALRVMHESYTKSREYYESIGKDSAASWNKHRIEDVMFLASIIQGLKTVKDEPSETGYVCPF